jgi:hypothetical protein
MLGEATPRIVASTMTGLGPSTIAASTHHPWVVFAFYRDQ